MKKIVALMFGLMIGLLVLPQTITVKAVNLPSRNTQTTVTANVPEGFSESITFTFEENLFQMTFPCTLNRDNGYTYSQELVKGSTFKLYAEFEGCEDYIMDFPEEYTAEGDQQTITFNIVKMTEEEKKQIAEEAEEAERKKAEEEEAARLEEEKKKVIDPLTGIETPESIKNRFIDKMSAVDQECKEFMVKGSGNKDSFLNADPTNTSEQWENMSDLEKFFYHHLYNMPHTYLTRYDYANEDELIEEISYRKDLYAKYKDGDKVYEALEEVYRWHYKYWLRTGVVANPFKYATSEEQQNLPVEPDENMNTSTEEPTDSEEQAKPEEEQKEEVRKEDPVTDSVPDNTSDKPAESEESASSSNNTLSILLVVFLVLIIIAAIAFIVMTMKKNREKV